MVLAISMAAALATGGGHVGALAPAAHAAWIASYRIEVALDVERRELRGDQILTWRNHSEDPVDAVWLHLYWNGARDADSTFLREIDPSGTEAVVEEAGWIELDHIRTEDGEDLLGNAEFRQPDDGNLRDRTLLRVPLAHVLEPGAAVSLHVGWRSRIPIGFDRTGQAGDFYFISQWYPKAAVQPSADRMPHQYHSMSEFFADFGVYDVAITVPSGFVVGATGRLRSDHDNGDGTTTLTFYQEDVHDFAWVADRDFLDVRRPFAEPGLPSVDVRVLVQPEHAYAVERYLDAAMQSIRYFGRHYGPYPYGVLTVVDPQAGSTAGGMEYPTLVTGGVGYRDPSWALSPEDVTVHEFGHQYWYGIVATDEFESSWLDEGFTTYSTARALDAIYGPGISSFEVDEGLLTPYQPLIRPRSITLHPFPRAITWSSVAGWLRDLPPVSFPAWVAQPAIDLERRELLQSGLAEVDPLESLAWEFLDMESYGVNSYSRAAVFLATLEAMLGTETFDIILREWFERGRYRHPTSDEFLEIIERISGREISSFFDQVVHGQGGLDYLVESATVIPSAEGHLSEVLMRRRGSIVIPVTVRTEFADGTAVDEVWDGASAWKRYRYERNAPATLAEIEPGRMLWLDADLTDNAMTVVPDGSAARRRAVDFLAWIQNVLFWFGMMA